MIVNNTCPICSAKMNGVFTVKVLSKHEAVYESCADCGLLRAANPIWLEEAYANPINLSDTGIVMRNFLIASKLSNVLHFSFGYRKNQKFVDIAGGYGLLTRLMRDFGFDFYWADKFCQNFVSRGFEYNSSVGQSIAITAIEVLEHVVDPVAFVMESLQTHQADTFVFTTELFEGPPPDPQAWWYYSFETGQHISFFQKRTLERMAKKLNLNFITCNGLHIFSKNRINPVLVYFLTLKIATLTLPWIVRSIRGSKTIPDHYLMLSKKD
jgi:hypothetical protein